MEKIEPKKERKTLKKIKNEYYNMKPHIIRKDNLRLIEPYEFKYQLYIKGRWVGKTLISVLNSEFTSYTKEYFIKAINTGKILINNNIVFPEYKLKRNDFLTHLTIRKENPIIDKKLEIIYDDNNFLAVNKPSSWPVHVCGGYQFNTLQRILLDEYGYDNIKVLHRLDKHTSGVVLFAKNKNSAERFREKLHSDLIQKIYFARVKGNFKDENVVVKRYIIALDNGKGIYNDISDEEAEKIKKENKIKSSLLNLDGSQKNNFKESDVKKNESIENCGNEENNNELNDPKFSETKFEKLFYDEKSNTSVVICKPKTGRTHQIRIHLKYLGFPIANDPCYGGIVYNDLKEFDDPKLKEYQLNSEDKDNISVSELFCYKIWLHAWSYKFDKYEFKTKEPEWANKSYKIEHKF
jgi:tRNA pseudouridine synthase 9